MNMTYEAYTSTSNAVKQAFHCERQHGTMHCHESQPTCSPCVLVILKYWPALSSTALPLPPGTFIRSLTGVRLVGTETSLDGLWGAVNVAAPATCDGRAMQVTDRTVFTGLLLLSIHRCGVLRTMRRLDTAAAS